MNPMNPDSVRPKPAIDVSEKPSRDRRVEWLIAADYSARKYNCIDTGTVASPTVDRSDAVPTEAGVTTSDGRRAKRRSRGLTVEISVESRSVDHYV